jgi:hypothetical protein
VNSPGDAAPTIDAPRRVSIQDIATKQNQSKKKGPENDVSTKAGGSK